MREAIEIILKARGQWDDAVESFLAELEREAARQERAGGRRLMARITIFHTSDMHNKLTPE